MLIINNYAIFLQKTKYAFQNNFSDKIIFHFFSKYFNDIDNFNKVL